MSSWEMFSTAADLARQLHLGYNTFSVASWQGWGVQAMQDIARGAFVCEYVGEYVTTPEATQRLQRYDTLKRQQHGRRTAATKHATHTGHDGVAGCGSGGALATAVEGLGGWEVLRALRHWHGHALLVGAVDVQGRHGLWDWFGSDGTAGSTVTAAASQAAHVEGAVARYWPHPHRNALPAIPCILLQVVRQVLPSGLTLRANIDATHDSNVARFINHRCAAQHGLERTIDRRRLRGSDIVMDVTTGVNQ